MVLYFLRSPNLVIVLKYSTIIWRHSRPASRFQVLAAEGRRIKFVGNS